MNTDRPFSNRKLLLSLLSAALLVASFPPFNVWPCAFIAFVPLFIIISRTRGSELFFFSYFSGFLFFVGTIYWITHVSAFGCVFLIMLYALFWPLFSILVWHIFKKIETSRKTFLWYALIAAVWSGLEVIRTYLYIFGFGWALLGHSQTSNIPFIQTATIWGVYGVSWSIMFVNILVYALLASIKRNRRHFFAWAGVLVIFCSVIYWYGFLMMSKHPQGTVVRVGVVQPNIPQNQKWDPRYKQPIIEKYAKLTEFISYDGPDLIVFPEAAYPGNFEREFEGSLWKKTFAGVSAFIHVGAVRIENFEKEFNSAYLISPAGTFLSVYDKIKLVPFGEYIPARSFFTFIGLTKLAYSLGVGDFQKGIEYTVAHLELGNRGNVSYSTLICFEDLFPYLARKFVASGADFLIVITNDAWFGETSAAHQHLQASVFRAVENGCYVVRAANTGVSGFISPQGEILNTVRDSLGKETFVTGGISRAIFAKAVPTFYKQGGYLFSLLFFLLTVGVIVMALVSRAKLFKTKKL